MISNLRLQNFRSYRDATFEFGDGVNIIVGPNASGKTNLLEAILVMARGKSYRAADRELIKHKAKWARLDAQQADQNRSVVWKDTGENLSKEFRDGGTVLKRLPIIRQLPAVIFEPDSLQHLTQSPSLRREFIDDIIERTDPLFASSNRYYKRALAQRNALLKQARSFTPDQMFIWSVRLSELGGQIVESRRRFIDDNQDELAKLYRKLAGKKHLASLEYRTKITSQNYGTQMLKVLEDRLDLDKTLGYTTVGPHRDDIMPVLDGHDLMDSGSRGETRTLLLAMKLLEVQTLEKILGKKPILLLDDVFSELDGKRRLALTTYLKNHQTFITTTDADNVVEHFLNNCTVIPTG